MQIFGHSSGLHGHNQGLNATMGQNFQIMTPGAKYGGSSKKGQSQAINKDNLARMSQIQKQY